MIKRKFVLWWLVISCVFGAFAYSKKDVFTFSFGKLELTFKLPKGANDAYS